MSDVASASLSIGIMLVEHLIFFVLWSSVLQWKQNKPMTFVIAFLLLGTTSFVTNVFISEEFTKLLIYLMLVFILLRILCNNAWYFLLFLSAAGMAYLKAVDNIIIYLSSLILNITPQASFENPYSFILFALLSKLIEFIGAWCFSRIFSKRRYTDPAHWQAWLQTLPLPVAACIFLSVALQLSFTQPDTAPLLLLLGLVFLLLCALQLFIAYRLDKQQKSDEENRQLKQTLALCKESLQSLTEAYTAQRSLTHEFNNRLAVITSLTQQENLQALSRYLCDIQQTSQDAMLAVYTGNSVIDAVVNQKHRIAVQHGIAVDYDMMSLAGLVLPEAKLAVVISNLLDNAIEACAEYTGKRLIGLKVKLHQEQLVLMVTNPSSNAPKKIDGRWVTSKSDFTLHGFGLCNVERILDSFDAEYASDYSNGIFSYVAFIPLQNPAFRK